MAEKVFLDYEGLAHYDAQIKDYIDDKSTKTAGAGITISNDTISAERNPSNTYTKTEVNTLLADKQAALTAGVGISIINGVIAAIMNDTNTYTKTEVDALLNALNHLQMRVVATRPLTGEDNIIYLVGNDTDGYRQWVYINNSWVDLGSSEISLNDYYTKTETDTKYQNKLTSGDGINISSTNVISTTLNPNTAYNKTEINNLLINKQDKLTSGDGISISAANVISTTINPNTAYNKTEINNLLTNKQDKLTAGSGISFSGNTISAMRNPDNTYLKAEVDGKLNNKQNTLTAGTGITISGNTISGRDSYTKTETDTLLNAKQAKLTAGDGITISSANVISASGGGSSDITVSEANLTYNSGWSGFPAASGGTPPKPVKISFGTTASVVQLAGDFRPTTNKETGYDGLVASLPEGFEPDGHIRVKGHYGNSDYSWLLTITPDGDVRFSNFPMSVPSDNKFSFSAMWIRKSG